MRHIKNKKKQEVEVKKERYQIICHSCGNKWTTNEKNGCSCGNRHVLVNDHDKLTSRYLDEISQ